AEPPTPPAVTEIQPPQPQSAAPVREPVQPPLNPDVPAFQYPSRGLTSLELARKEVLDFIGPNGLGLRPDEHERYFTSITGKGELKALTPADLEAVIRDAKDRLAKRDE
ncbi:MAG: hypothetical protein IJU98_11650, partial [Synergistaceae bacterium]|nr:hypothetical protein [Synergistaceae bacterium]